MNAGAPLPDASSATAADGPLRSDDAFASAASGLRLKCYTRNGVQESIESLRLALEAGDSALEFLAEAYPDIFHRAPDDGFEFCPGGSDVIFTISVRFAAGLAGEATVTLKPTQRYREMLATLASHVKWHVFQVHDWPVLSVDVPTTTVSEAAGVSIPGSGAANAADAGGAAQ